ncbi:hypothetical protein Pla163_09120 [Planctomycetes bacterium Pla163]|uniref:N-acetyltransferase domain-containing protein n=1 Tax=Rohdeia mirabilis TaxID=2528008 RepID=A0A518CX53_9BACT|nr:hypothetical protein Pla163_09120 [Planctomycetes bacterium Pla163]
MKSLLVAPLLFVVASCAGPHHHGGHGHADLTVATPFDPAFEAPWMLATERMRLEPLRPAVAKLDYDGFMSSIPHLQNALRWGSWPSEGFELAQNEKDLQRHWDEFGRGEAFAYTVLTPDRERCIGCVYVNPVEGSPRAAVVNYWVTADTLDADFDTYLLAEVSKWFEERWPLDRAEFPTHREYTRGFEVADRAGLNPPDTLVGDDGEELGRPAPYWSR